MDFEEHYTKKEEDLLAKQRQEEEAKATTREADAVARYNKAIGSLSPLLPKLLAIYKANPPEDYRRLGIDGREMVAWRLNFEKCLFTDFHRSICIDGKNHTDLYMLTNGHLALMHCSEERDSLYDKIKNPQTGRVEETFIGVECKYGQEKFAGYLKPTGIKETAELSFPDFDCLTVTELVESALIRVTAIVGETEKMKAEKQVQVQGPQTKGTRPSQTQPRIPRVTSVASPGGRTSRSNAAIQPRRKAVSRRRVSSSEWLLDFVVSGMVIPIILGITVLGILVVTRGFTTTSIMLTDGAKTVLTSPGKLLASVPAFLLIFGISYAWFKL